MSDSPRFLTPSEAARRLGISVKALRLYEARGLVVPQRTAAGWRSYGPEDMAKAAAVAELRGLSLSLAQVARVLTGDPGLLEPALAAHQDSLEVRIRQIEDTVARVSALRRSIAQGDLPEADQITRAVRAPGELEVALDLPWPWGGERFELRGLQPVTYIVGPLGSGKTRLAQQIAESLPKARFLGLDRLDAQDLPLSSQAEQVLAWLVDEGGESSIALRTLVAALTAEDWSVMVVDMVEAGLDRRAQEALGSFLRQGRTDRRPLLLLTRSSVILDLEDIGPEAAILLCPANHSPPTLVAPYPGAPGYEAVATCLAAPEVRARTEGVIAYRPARQDNATKSA